MRTILHKNDNAEVLLTTVANGYDIEKAKEELGGCLVDINNVRHDYISAYSIKNNQAIIDLEKARELKVEIIRKSRDEKFIDFDKRYNIALKDEVDMDILKQERQKLKDAPQNAEVYLDSCISLQEIDALSLAAIL